MRDTMDLREFARTILRAHEHLDSGHTHDVAARKAVLLEGHSERWIRPIYLLITSDNDIEDWAKKQAEWKKLGAKRNRRR